MIVVVSETKRSKQHGAQLKDRYFPYNCTVLESVGIINSLYGSNLYAVVKARKVLNWAEPDAVLEETFIIDTITSDFDKAHKRYITIVYEMEIGVENK